MTGLPSLPQQNPAEVIKALEAFVAHDTQKLTGSTRNLKKATGTKSVVETLKKAQSLIPILDPSSVKRLNKALVTIHNKETAANANNKSVLYRTSWIRKIFSLDSIRQSKMEEHRNELTNLKSVVQTQNKENIKEKRKALEKNFNENKEVFQSLLENIDHPDNLLSNEWKPIAEFSKSPTFKSFIADAKAKLDSLDLNDINKNKVIIPISTGFREIGVAEKKLIILKQLMENLKLKYEKLGNGKTDDVMFMILLASHIEDFTDLISSSDRMIFPTSGYSVKQNMILNSQDPNSALSTHFGKNLRPTLSLLKTAMEAVLYQATIDAHKKLSIKLGETDFNTNKPTPLLRMVAEYITSTYQAQEIGGMFMDATLMRPVTTTNNLVGKRSETITVPNQLEKDLNRMEFSINGKSLLEDYEKAKKEGIPKTFHVGKKLIDHFGEEKIAKLGGVLHQSIFAGLFTELNIGRINSLGKLILAPLGFGAPGEIKPSNYQEKIKEELGIDVSDEEALKIVNLRFNIQENEDGSLSVTAVMPTRFKIADDTGPNYDKVDSTLCLIKVEIKFSKEELEKPVSEIQTSQVKASVSNFVEGYQNLIPLLQTNDITI